jgi:hypothetical protein
VWGEGLIGLNLVESDGGCVYVCVCVCKSKQSPYRPDRPWWLQDFKASSISRQSTHKGRKVSRKNRLPLLAGRYSWYLFMLEAEYIAGFIAFGRLKLMKNSNDPIGNRTLDLPVVSAVPQQTALPLPQHVYVCVYMFTCWTAIVSSVYGLTTGWVILRSNPRMCKKFSCCLFFLIRQKRLWG